MAKQRKISNSATINNNNNNNSNSNNKHQFVGSDNSKYPNNYPIHKYNSESINLLNYYNLNDQLININLINKNQYNTTLPVNINNINNDYSAKRDYVTVYEYKFGNHLIIWDYVIGWVYITSIWKAVGNYKADVLKLISTSPEIKDKVYKTKGGCLKVQGTWIQYDIAKKLASKFCYPIRFALIPLFGCDFINLCLTIGQPGYGLFQLIVSDKDLNKKRRRKRRRRKVFSNNINNNNNTKVKKLINSSIKNNDYNDEDYKENNYNINNNNNNNNNNNGHSENLNSDLDSDYDYDSNGKRRKLNPNVIINDNNILGRDNDDEIIDNENNNNNNNNNNNFNYEKDQSVESTPSTSNSLRNSSDFTSNKTSISLSSVSYQYPIPIPYKLQHLYSSPISDNNNNNLIMLPKLENNNNYKNNNLTNDGFNYNIFQRKNSLISNYNNDYNDYNNYNYNYDYNYNYNYRYSNYNNDIKSFENNSDINLKQSQVRSKSLLLDSLLRVVSNEMNNLNNNKNVSENGEPIDQVPPVPINAVLSVKPISLDDYR